MARPDQAATMPSEISPTLTLFDRFATAVEGFVSRAWFFSFCVLLILIWAPSILLFPTLDTWQLVINTATTIITFLLVALLQNTQSRANNAVQHKLNAIADGLADLMTHLAGENESHPILQDVHELRAAVGLEQRESA
ncbi:MAG TPA: low affinity iron permease family protein [Actinomycetes bacterium]|nr:low affinity iron permease family protein [Actinomycetes bacterium]